MRMKLVREVTGGLIIALEDSRPFGIDGGEAVWADSVVYLIQHAHSN